MHKKITSKEIAIPPIKTFDDGVDIHLTPWKIEELTLNKSEVTFLLEACLRIPPNLLKKAIPITYKKTTQNIST